VDEQHNLPNWTCLEAGREHWRQATCVEGVTNWYRCWMKYAPLVSSDVGAVCRQMVQKIEKEGGTAAVSEDVGFRYS
jgi:hypothetical protein